MEASGKLDLSAAALQQQGLDLVTDGFTVISVVAVTPAGPCHVMLPICVKSWHVGNGTLHAQHMGAQGYRRIPTARMSLPFPGEAASSFGAVDAPADPAPTRDQGLVRALAEHSCCIQVRHLASIL